MKRVVVLLLGGLLALAAVTAGTAGVQALFTGAQSNGSDTFFGCERQGKLIPGTLHVGRMPECRGQATLVSWSAEGPPRPPGLSGYVRVTESTGFSAFDFKNATAECPSGTKVLGGGAIIGSPPGHHQIGVFIADDFPVPGEEAWTVGARESVENGAVWGLDVYAICAEVTP
jgi:hypothetical protein